MPLSGLSGRCHKTDSLPVAECRATLASHVGDYAPFEIRYGEMAQWRGNSLRHYSHRNVEDETRVSFDFRVIPGSQWEEPGPKSLFRLGSYYRDALAPESLR